MAFKVVKTGPTTWRYELSGIHAVIPYIFVAAVFYLVGLGTGG